MTDRTRNNIIAVAILLVILSIMATLIRWQLVPLRENVNLQQAQIESNLQRRSDLIPNLVATVKGYAEYEEDIFDSITEARSNLQLSLEEGNLDDISEANDNLTLALNNMLSVLEDNPELKASEHFRTLEVELAGTENRIAVSRYYYNEAVNEYNTAIQTPPTSFFARFLGFKAAEYFEASEEANEVPNVDLN